MGSSVKNNLSVIYLSISITKSFCCIAEINWASLIAQLVKTLSAEQEARV